MSNQIFVYRFKIWCQTDNKYEYTWAHLEPTHCPTDMNHTIDTNKTSFIQKIDALYLTNDASPYKYRQHAIVADTTSGNITIMLKSVTRVNWPVLVIKPVANNSITIDPASNQLIDGASTLTITSVGAIILESDGTSWTSTADYLYRQIFSATEVNYMSSVTNGDQKGDVIVDDGQNLSYLSIGENQEFLQVDHSVSEGIKWTNLATLSLTMSNKTINASENTLTNISDSEIKLGAAIDAAKIANGTVSNTEFQYLHTVTGNVQSQLDAKIPYSEENLLSIENGVPGDSNHILFKITKNNATDSFNLSVDNTNPCRVNFNTQDGTYRQAIQFASNNNQNATIFGVSRSNDTGNSWQPVIVAQQNGRIGIGNNAPTEALDVSGNIYVSGNIIVLGTVDGRDLASDGTTQDNHIAATSGVHGVVGSIVGTTDSQSLTNKTMDANSNTISNLSNASIATGAAINATKIADGTVSNAKFQYLNSVTSNVQTQLDSKAATSHTHAASDITSGTLSVVRGGTGLATLTSGKILQGAGTSAITATLDAPVGTIVGTSDTQTLTNKTINADNNTVSNLANAQIKTLAAIDATKIADGTVTNAEFQYLHTVSNNIQTQLDSKLSGPGAAVMDLEMVCFSGTSGNALTGVGVRHYGALATGPTTPTPQAGDRYYNTAINHEMCYDGTRAKWLSVAVLWDGNGSNGNTNAGNFYRRWNSMTQSATTGPHIPKGTIIRIGYTTSNAVNHTLQVLVSGSVVAELASGGAASAFNNAVNADFEAGNFSTRNKTGSSTTSNMQSTIYYKLRA